MKDLSSRSKKPRTLVLMLLALVLLVGLVIYGQLFLFNLDKLPRGGTIPNGGEVYAVSQGSLTDGPRFKEVDITPRKVSLGDTQLLIVKMERPEEVALVKAVTELDSSVKEVNLTKADDNEWRGEWVVEDTSTKTYRTTFVALGRDGKENRFTMAWSDPCSGIPLGGSGTLGADCTISGVDGVDNGNLNLNGRTLTIPSGATFVWNAGKTITANGTIAVSGQLKKTNLWIKDADNDGYTPNSTDQLAQDTQPSSYQRRNTRSGTNDCYDSNSNAYPGSSYWGSSNRGDGSFDYNCDGSINTSFSYYATQDYPQSGQYSCYYYTNSSQCGQSLAYCGYYNEYHWQGSQCSYSGSYCNSNYQGHPVIYCYDCKIGTDWNAYTHPTSAALACR